MSVFLANLKFSRMFFLTFCILHDTFWLCFVNTFRFLLSLSYANILLSGLSGRAAASCFSYAKEKPALSRQPLARKLKSQTYFLKSPFCSTAPTHTTVPLSSMSMIQSKLFVKITSLFSSIILIPFFLLFLFCI